MSMTQLVLGTSVSAAVLSFAVSVVLPSAPPFVIHSIIYDDGMVLQDRTITTDGVAFYAQWAATVENADTGDSIRWCEGSGANAYANGHKEVKFTLEDWTGRETCTPESLPPGRYALRASWRWGAKDASMRSPVFVIGDR